VIRAPQDFEGALDLPACRPPWWARGRHGQTVIGNYLPFASSPYPFEAVRVQLEDGDRLAGREYPGETGTVVCFFHGLAGSNDAHYMHRGVTVAGRRGHWAGSRNHRGCGDGAGLAAGTYHSGRADDLGAVFAEVRQRHPGKRIVAVGFSLSGNALLLNLGEGIGRFEKPDAAIAVNPPVNLEKGALLLKRGFNRVYDLRFVLRCRKAIRDRVRAGLIPDQYKVKWWRPLHDFDNAYTAPASGFRDREDYYARCSAAPHLHRIDRPTVILMAKDDPFIDWRDHADAAKSEFVSLHPEEAGGHMGFVDQSLPRHQWLDRALEHYLVELLA